ncbi:MAG: DUF2066 domain-containing protein [Gammaproteobacteria bacterium]|jgi:hypothetical protein
MANSFSRTRSLAGIACLLCLYAALTSAADPQQLFESEVVVSSQAPGLRPGAFQQALRIVLVRVAGDNAVLASEPGKALLGDAPGLVQQYRYYTEPDRDPPVLKLWVRFDGDAIRDTLQRQGQSYWGIERPDTLLWLAVEDRGRRYVVSADDDSEVRRKVEQAAQQRGVPILFPLMDLEDQSRARYSDIWGGFFDNVLAASARYSPQAVLIGRLHRSPSGGWSSRWYLRAAGRPTTWSDSRPQLDSLLRQGMEDTADALASRFAVGSAGGVTNTTSISVDGVNSLAAYARLKDYLASLTPVSDLQLERVDGATLQFGLWLNGSLQDLARTVTIGTVLEPVPGGLPGSYRLRQ